MKQHERCAAVAAEWHDVGYYEILGRSRLKTVAKARHAAWWLCRRTTDLSYPQLGKLFGRDHTTIINGVMRAEVERRSDVGYMRELDAMLATLRRRVEQPGISGRAILRNGFRQRLLVARRRKAAA